MQGYLLQHARVKHELLIFIWQKSLVKKNDFILIEGLYMMTGEGFFFSSFDPELVDTEQVSLMIQLSGSKTKFLSTRHG